MDRRTVLKAIPAALLSSGVMAQEPEIRRYGALPALRSRRVSFNRAFQQFEGIGKGKRSHLWKLFEIATNAPLKPHSQPNEGDCVGQAYALGCDLLACADIFMRFEPEKWVEKASVEMIYAGSRVQIGDGAIGRADGSYGEWAARFVKEYGVLHRLKYGDIDLRGYSAERSDYYSTRGVPQELIPIAREHPCATYTKITTWPQARDALYVGQPILLCSSYAFERQRDSNGFAAQLLSRRHKRFLRYYSFRPKWFHCLLLAGYEEIVKPYGGLIINSWDENWISGPKRLGQPEGSFWATPEEIERMLQDWEDCFAISNYVGHPQKFLQHNKLY